MAKQQQFFDLFTKYDDDADGQIDQQQFIGLVTELGVPYQYPGTVTKIIRKINYLNPDKLTLNLLQAKEYYNSFQTHSKHEIWKAKLSLLNSAHQIKQSVSEGPKGEGAAPPAAPGMENLSKQESDKKPQEGHINILVGPAKPVYSSQLEIHFQKSQKSQKAKPFVKIQVTSKSQERAKRLQVVFKESFNTLVDIFAQEEPNYADIAKSIHVNSVVNNCKTTFFITTAAQDAVHYIQILTQFYELAFNTQLIFKGHFKFQFDYDFEQFVKESTSSFYDIFTKNCRLKIDVNVLNFIKSIRRHVKTQLNNQDPVDLGLLSFLVHIQGVQGDFQFENSQGEGQTETKEELNQMLAQLGSFFSQLDSKGIKIKQLIELLDDNILIQANGGDWRATVFLRLKNINKIFLHHIPAQGQVEECD